MLHQQIKGDVKEAMKAKEETKLSVLRGLLADFTNELVAKGRKPQEELSDEEAMVVISRAAKRRKDSILQFRSGGREDLAESEAKELVVLETFLPKQMSEEEIKKVVKAKVIELGITDKTQMGQLMSAVMSELKGKADGGLVKKMVDEQFVDISTR